MTKEDLIQFEIDMGTYGNYVDQPNSRVWVTVQVIPPKNYDALLKLINDTIETERWDASNDGYNEGMAAGENH